VNNELEKKEEESGRGLGTISENFPEDTTQEASKNLNKNVSKSPQSREN
jgi:hypothetical protein